MDDYSMTPISDTRDIFNLNTSLHTKNNLSAMEEDKDKKLEEEIKKVRDHLNSHGWYGDKVEGYYDEDGNTCVGIIGDIRCTGIQN